MIPYQLYNSKRSHHSRGSGWIVSGIFQSLLLLYLCFNWRLKWGGVRGSKEGEMFKKIGWKKKEESSPSVSCFCKCSYLLTVCPTPSCFHHPELVSLPQTACITLLCACSSGRPSAHTHPYTCVVVLWVCTGGTWAAIHCFPRAPLFTAWFGVWHVYNKLPPLKFLIDPCLWGKLPVANPPP